MKKTLSILFALALVLSFSLVATTPVAAAERHVPGTYATIQDAINAANPGDTIMVAAGTYVEVGQIVINKNLTIIGADKTTTIIKPDQNNVNWFVVQAGVVFHLSGVTLDGQGHNIRAAIRTHGSGSISSTIIKNIRNSQYLGWGIAMEWSTGGQVWTISGNQFRDIERVGILVDGSGNSATVSGNTITGNGYGDWVGYGVEVGDGANAVITGNTISRYRGVASTDGSVSAGILVTSYFGPNPQALVTGNDLRENTSGIHVGYSPNDTSTVVANFNNIAGNDNYGVKAIATLTTPVDATNNWWGHVSGPSGVGPGSGDAVTEKVNFTPWLTTTYPPATSVPTGTGTGVAYFAASHGAFANLAAVAAPSLPSVSFPHGMFSFQITGLTPGQTVDVTITLPSAVPVGTVWWKYDNGRWHSLPNLDDNGNNIMKIRLTDGGTGDLDNVPGQITDPGGAGNPMTVGWDGSPVSKASVLAPWLVLLAAIMAGAGLLVTRRRRVEI